MNPKGIRVQKAIAQAGVASRRRAEGLILAGQVRVNGAVVRELGLCLTPGQDTLEVAGRTLDWHRPPARQVWALYKPKRCVSTLSDPEGRSTLRDFFPRSSQRLFPIGRLDYDAEGLILLTNDGDFANLVAHPSHSVPKTYLVKVKGLVARETLRRLAEGPVVEGEKRRAAKARVLHTLTDKTWLEVVLREGVNHHLKKMFASVGHRVLKIKRFQIGPVTLQDMAPGDLRRLERQEIAQLLEAAEGAPGSKAGRKRKKRVAPPAATDAAAPSRQASLP